MAYGKSYCIRKRARMPLSAVPPCKCSGWVGLVRFSTAIQVVICPDPV
jgi:hypothetical protein